MSPAQAFVAAIDARTPSLRRQGCELEVEDMQDDKEFEPHFDGRTNCVFIHDLYVEERGRGLGRTLLAEAVRLADELGVVLYLNPCAITHYAGHLPQPDLEAWYRRYGFRWWEDHVMQRDPKIS